MATKFFTLLLIVCAALSNVASAADYPDELFQSWKSSVGDRILQSLKSPRNSGNFKVKITQGDLAAHLDLSQPRISKIISGTQPISLVQGFEAAKFLNVDPEWLLDFQLIQGSINKTNFPASRSTMGSDFFFDVIQFALGRFSETSLNIKRGSCERVLGSYSTEDLVEELKRRGWTVIYPERNS